MTIRISIRVRATETGFLWLRASRPCFQPRINVTPLRSKLKQFFHRVPAILIFTWRGQAEDTLVMMKDIFPFSQLGHALTHHYPIDLIHGFPSTSPYLPRLSTTISLSSPLFHPPLYTSTCRSLYAFPQFSRLYLPLWHLSFSSRNALSSSLFPSTFSQFSAISSSPRFSHF